MKLRISQWLAWGVTGLLVCSTGLAGCASPAKMAQERYRKAIAEVEQQKSALAAADACCINFLDATSEALPSGQTVEVTLDGASPVGTFPDGRTRFRMYALPPLGSGARLTVTKVNMRGGLVSPPIFSPELFLLDGAKQIIGSAARLQFDRRYIGWNQEGYRAELSLSGLPRVPRYLVVAAAPSAVGTDAVRGAMSTLMPATPGVFVPVSIPEMRIPFGYEGIALLLLEPGSSP